MIRLSIGTKLSGRIEDVRYSHTDYVQIYVVRRMSYVSIWARASVVMRLAMRNKDSKQFYWNSKNGVSTKLLYENKQYVVVYVSCP